MSYIIDRIILIILSLLVLMETCDMGRIITLGLTAIVVSGLSYYFDEKKIGLGMCLLYMVACLMIPELIFIAPIVMYELYRWKKPVWIIVLIALSIKSIVDIGTVPVVVIMLFVLGMVIAVVLYNGSSKIEELRLQVIHIRDDSVERNMLLAEKNKHLIEKQDQEVYVATLKERNRIAREIHDNVGHMITRSILQMGALMTINKEEPLHGQLEAVKNNLDVAMNNIRESVHDLHDESVDMKQAIEEMIKPLEEGYWCKLDYDAGTNIDRKYKYAIIGIVKEAISNIIKYSTNNTVDIIIREHPAMLQVIIHDYQKGDKYKNMNRDTNVKQSCETGKGIGLQNMEDRVSALNGNLTIDKSNGFKIFVTMPKG